MAIHKFTIFSVKFNDMVADSFSTETHGNEEAALAAARKSRDGFNASEFGVKNNQPYRIVRGFRQKKVKHL